MSLVFALEIVIAVICLLCSSLALYCVYYRKYNYWTKRNVPVAEPIPFFGLFFTVLKGESLFELDLKLYQKFGRLFGTFFGREPVIYVGDPELIKLILVKDFNNFSTRRIFVTGNDIVDSFVSAMEGGDRWRNIRNTITPAFSSGKLKNMIPIISDSATISTKNFAKYAESQEFVDAKKLYGNYTLDVIANVAFGTRLDSHNDPENEFVTQASKVFSSEISIKTFLTFTFPKLAKFLNVAEFFPREAIDFFKATTENIMERRQTSNEVRHDFLQLLIESQKEDAADTTQNVEQETDANQKSCPIKKVEQIKRKPLTRHEVLAQCILFFIAGYETTATSLALVSFYFACNPDKQIKALEEVDRIWKNRETLDAEAVYEAKYIEAAIEETLRLCPPAIKLERTAVKDYELADTGITITKGMVVEIPVYAMHYDPEFFPDAESFRPERFLPKDNNEVLPYTYLPFGSGPRNCVAMRLAHLEIKMCLLYIMRNMEFATCSKTKIPMEFKKKTGLLQPTEVLLSVRKRN